MTRRRDEVHGVLSFAVEGMKDEDRVALLQYLDTLVQKNQAIKVDVSLFEKAVVVSGDDELQLREASKKILHEHQVEIGELKINFRETIRQSAEAEGKYIRQTGGSNNYGLVKVRLEPNERGRGFEFIDGIKSGVIPREYIKPTEQGIREAMMNGVLAGYEMVDFKSTLFDGSYHPIDSNEMAFRIAGSMAFKGAAKKASPVLLEPVMAVEMTVLEEHTDTLIKDINSRRGRIEKMERVGDSQMITAMVPLAEVMTFSVHGRPSYAMRFARYEPTRPSHGPYGDDAGTYAKEQRGPKPGAGSAAAKLDD